MLKLVKDLHFFQINGCVSIITDSKLTYFGVIRINYLLI